VVSTEMH